MLAACPYQMPMCSAALAIGGNVRVGLEDSLYIAKGRLAISNPEQVRKTLRAATGLRSNSKQEQQE
jgi:uncharacterized protein (DUF849 family)